MQASASTKELLENDAADPVVRLDRHPLWEAVLDGRLAKERLTELVVTFYPTVTGTARYLFSSKVSTLMPEDGKAVFRDLYDALTVPEASADRGWRELGLAVGAAAEALDDVLTAPVPEVVDYVSVARGFGHRSAHEGVGAAWGVERQLPNLWGRLADVLAARYEIPEPALRYLRYRARSPARSSGGSWLSSTVTSSTPGGRTRPGERPASACGRGRAWASESAWRDQRTER